MYTKNIYFLKVDEKTGEITNGFLFLGVMNQETKQIDIEVFDEEGNHMYTLPTGVAVNEEEGADNIGLGVKESTLILVKENGIYEAELGDKEFTQVVDSTKDNLYYLSPEYSIFSSSGVYKGENDDYYVMLYKDKMSNNTEYRFCHYTPVS